MEVGLADPDCGLEHRFELEKSRQGTPLRISALDYLVQAGFERSWN